MTAHTQADTKNARLSTGIQVGTDTAIIRNQVQQQTLGALYTARRHYVQNSFIGIGSEAEAHYHI